MNKEFNYKRLKFRKMFDITLDEVALEVGISIGYLSRLERGLFRDILNPQKRAKLRKYIIKLNKRAIRGMYL